jgi:transcription termination factor Rho
MIEADQTSEAVEDKAVAEAPAQKKTTRKSSTTKATASKTTTRKRTSTKAAADDAAPEDAEKAPKTTRRRTTKKAQAEASEQLALVSDDEAAVEKPKAKRGRPKKAAATGDEKAAASEEEPAEKPKAKRGRPKKTAAAEDESAAASEEAAEKPKAKRGRPKKTVEAEVEAPAEDSAEKPKAKRGRPRKTAAAADEKAEADEEGAAAEKPKARRGRPRKTAAATSEDAEDKADGADAAGKEEATSSDEKKDASPEKKEASADARKTEASGKQQNNGENGRQENNGKRNNRRRNRRNRHNNQRREIVPSATRDELSALSDEDLIVKARELEVDPAEYGERDDLVSAVYDALLQAEGFVLVEGILDLLQDGYGFIRTDGYLPGEHDVYVGTSMVRRNALRKGDYITGRVRPPRDNEKYPALNTVITLNDEPFEGAVHRAKFANLTPIYPDERLVLEHGKNSITARAIDLVSPIGKGQRGLIVSPPKAGKTTVLKDIAAAISANNPEVHLMCLLVDERPEEVTDMERSIDGEVISSTFDMPSENHIAVAELVIERAKRLVEKGEDVVILLDSITRLARAYNLSQPASGRILSGGVDSTALYPPKRFLGAARNIEFGGSLTILGTALIDTGSKMDEVIFEEFKGTGNMELKLDRQLAEKRIFPAIDPVASSTRKDELLVDPQEAPLIWGLRRLLANMNNTERAMKMLIQSLKQTETNQEFLIKSARKASRQAASL